MSDRRRVLGAIALGAIALGAMALGALPSGAQTAAEWRSRASDQALRSRELRATYEAAALAAERRLDSLEIEGIRLHYNGSSWTRRDLEGFTEGVRRALVELRERHGPQAPSLLAPLELGAWTYPTRFNRGPIRIRAKGRGGEDAFSRPLDPADVSRFLRQIAGERLAARHPELRSYAGSLMLIDLTDDYWFNAFRSLSISWTSVGRRCAAGTIPACAVVAAPFERATALEKVFDRTDHAWLVATSYLRPGADSGVHQSQARCRAGADTACHRIVQWVRINDPISSPLRGTIASVAFEMGGVAALDRLGTAPRGDPVRLLAHVAGTSTDSLLTTWQARLETSRADVRTSAPVVLLSTVAWCGLVILGASRRRPS